jgi:anti-sigma regulatory factor (Ser/Thr protein kinase)
MPVLTQTDQLKDELIDVLSHDEVDYGKIQSLSTKLAKLDPEFVRFSADAALISRLGRELVARQETAVSELVKNAYDADATEVSLIVC